MKSRASYPAALIKTPVFRDWFVNSQAIDGRGRPRVLYHGTTRAFERFDAGCVGSRHLDWEVGAAFYFSAYPSSASAYAESRWSNPDDAPCPGACVMPVFLSMQNPLIEDFQGLPASDWIQNYIERAQQDGHDGLIAIDIDDGAIDTQFVVFSPDQIRSIYAFDLPTRR